MTGRGRQPGYTPAPSQVKAGAANLERYKTHAKFAGKRRKHAVRANRLRWQRVREQRRAEAEARLRLHEKAAEAARQRNMADLAERYPETFAKLQARAK